MSALANQQQQRRRIWALAGSGHDRLIAVLRIALPVAIGVLLALLTVAPITVGRDISFVLSKDRVDVASERMRLVRAQYRGRDSKDQPFQLDAASAVQATSRDPIVRLQTLDANIKLVDGPATVKSGRGRYDMDTDRVAFDGPVRLDTAGGYQLLTRDVLLDMKTKGMVSRGPVDGKMPLGTFAADRLRANLDTKVVDLIGRARLHIVQRTARAGR